MDAVDYYAHMKIGRRADRIHRRMEQDALRRADAITIAIPRGRVTSRPLGLATWRSCITGMTRPILKGTRSGLWIAPPFHGGLLGNDRYPAPLVEAPERLKEEG